MQVKGVYSVEKKYDLIWLTNGKTKQTESMKYFDFEKILHQSFTEKQIINILDEINCMRKVILDFDKGIAKKVIDKDYNFIQAMNAYFDPKKIQNQLDNFDEEIDVYNQDDTEKGGYFL